MQKKQFFLLIFLLFECAYPLFAQQKGATNDSLFCTLKKVFLYKKAGQGAGSSIVDTVLLGQKLVPIDKFGTKDVMEKQKLKAVTRDNVAGYWLRVKYGKQRGFIFSGALTSKQPQSATADFLLLNVEKNASYNAFFYTNLADYHWYCLENKGNMITMRLRNITALQYNTTELNDQKMRLIANPTTKTALDSVEFILGLKKKKYKWDVGTLFGACAAKFATQPALKLTIDPQRNPEQLQLPLPTTDWQLRLEIATETDSKNPRRKPWKLWFERRDGKQRQLLQTDETNKFSTSSLPTIQLDFFGDLDRDNKLDLILQVREDAQSQQKLFLSSMATAKNVVREVVTNDDF